MRSKLLDRVPMLAAVKPFFERKCTSENFPIIAVSKNKGFEYCWKIIELVKFHASADKVLI